jgi:hypothetical protein
VLKVTARARALSYADRQYDGVFDLVELAPYR